MLLASVVCACGTGGKKNEGNRKSLTVDIKDKNSFSEQAVFPDYRFIKLETTDESLLENVKKVVMCDGQMFVLSSIGISGNNVMAFDSTGHFLYKLARGRGPGEVSFVSDIDINQEKRELWVLDLYRNIKVFDWNGKYLRSISTEEPVLYFQALGENAVFFDSGMNKRTDDYAWTLVDGQKSVSFFPKVKSLSSGNLIHDYSFTRLGRDSVLVSDYFSDTIYCVTDRGKKVDILYVMDYKGRAMNTSLRLKEVENRKMYREMLKSRDLVSGITDLSVGRRKMFFKAEGRRNYYVIYDRVSDRSTIYSRLFDGLPEVYSSVGNASGSVFYVMTMSRLFKYWEEHPVSSDASDGMKKLRQACTNEEDNPVIIVCNYE